MRYRKFLYLFVVFSILFMGLIEVIYQNFRSNIYTNPIEYKVNGVLKSTHHKDYDSLFFSTSVTYGTLREYKLSDDVLELGTTFGVGFVGQYYMLQRYLKQNNKVKNIFFFVLPNSFEVVNFSSEIFNNNEELEESRKNGFVTIDSNYFYSRMHYLKIWNSTYRNISKKRLDLSGDFIFNSVDFKDVLDETVRTNFMINKTVDYYIDKIIDLCKEHNIEVTFVLEPLKKEKYIDFLNSDLRSDIQNKNINFIDTNAIHLFDDDDFFDGVHLKDSSKILYRILIDKHIKKLTQERQR